MAVGEAQDRRGRRFRGSTGLLEREDALRAIDQVLDEAIEGAGLALLRRAIPGWARPASMRRRWTAPGRAGSGYSGQPGPSLSRTWPSGRRPRSRGPAWPCGASEALKWEDLDFTEQRLTVRRALQRQRERGLVLVEPKTARSRRTVYFPHGTGEALRAHRRLQAEAQLRAGPYWQDNGFVFCRDSGEPLDPGGLSDRLQSPSSGRSTQIRVHDLRHTAATLHLVRGENPKVVQELLGHSTVTLTLDTYSHVTPAIHAAAARKMQALFADG